ncbi:MAG: DNA primase [Sulfobacillus benefaciens]|uniref:DNA primase n=1 Tax=Sulfobacillus benefaciens TaxID=453960 RepID=A0A2T2XGA3_9FIRM|nr:MAG: DNA primase [Sulfobacillus benefaciens]
MRGSGNGSQMVWKGITVKHPDRIIFPDMGLTRMEIMAYYDAIADVMIPHLMGRAITLKRWTEDIGGPMFYQKYWESQPIRIDNAHQLLQWVAQGTLEFHVPLGCLDRPHQHDWAVLDLDPPQDCLWSKVAEAAYAVALLWEKLAVPFVLKTSGGKGVHFYIPIEPQDHRSVVYWMKSLATLLAATFPESLTVERLKAQRGNRIYLDYLQNGSVRTMIGVYSMRATQAASVSTPVRLDELEYDPHHWTPARVLDRVAQVGDLFRIKTPRCRLGDVVERYNLLPI